MSTRIPLADVAGVTQRLAVLLGAGVAPASAWQHVAASVDSPVAAAAASEQSDHARALSEAVAEAPAAERDAWRGLAVAWAVATSAGAPLAPSLRSYATSLRELAQTQRDAQVALAAPVATARMVMALPAVGILFGMALGFNTLATLLTTPIGWGCIAVGAGLLIVAMRWNRRLVRSAQAREVTAGLGCDLMAIAMSGGTSLDRASELVTTALKSIELDVSMTSVDGVIELSRSAGVPAGELLRSHAEELRRDARAGAQEAAAALSVKLMLPLGLCVLPAFMVLGVLPLLVSVVSSTVGSM